MAELLEPLPDALEKDLAALNGETRIAAVATDLRLDGKFGEEWLCVTAERLLVYEPNGSAPKKRFEIKLTEVKDPQVEGLIGGGALVLKLDGKPAEILRFSNAQQRKFGRITKYLADVAKHHAKLAKGEKPEKDPVLAEDEEEAKRCEKCKLLLPEGSKVCPACLSKGKVLKRMLGYLQPYWTKMALISIVMLLSTGLALVPPYLSKPLFDVVLAPKAGLELATEERFRMLGWLVLGLVGALALGQLFKVVLGRLVIHVSTSLTHDLRAQLFSHLQFLSVRFFDKRQTGALIARVTRDTQALDAVLMEGMNFLLVNILTLVGIGVVLFVTNWKLAFLVLVPVPLVLFLSHRVWRRVITLWHRSGHLNSRLSATVGDSLSGVRVVKAFAKEEREITRFNERSGEVRDADVEFELVWTSLFPILWLLISSGGLLVTYVGGRWVLGQEIEIGTLIMFQGYLGMFYGPMQYLSNWFNYLARSFAAAERVFEILDASPDVPDSDNAIAIPKVKGDVEFKDVVFGYEKHKPVLEKVSFKVQAGEMIGLVGQSGAGKSTTINLISRFYDVTDGHIFIDGVDIKKIRQHDLRSQIGIVLQEPFLFNGTISENVAYGKPGATFEEIIAAAKAANAHDFICQRADGYDSQVGERGQGLSGGERQRISIARAILHNPRILILDEATSSVDSDTEKQIQEAIARLVKGRTTFAIAHRLSTLRNADKLVVLKEGKLAEMGTHAELMEKKGEFFRLVQLQEEMSKIVAIGG